MIALASGGWRAALRPEIGGCLAALDCDGVPILRPMDDEVSHPLDASCFPLVPYCNRIAAGRFAFQGREVALTPNLPPHPHPLHGLGWLAEWSVVRSNSSSALIEHVHDGQGEWPWAYRAHQHVALDEAGLTMRLMVENRSTGPAPMGLGFHPYFRRSAHSRVAFESRAMLGIDADCLADGTVLPADTLAPWSRGTQLPDTLVDHCFAGWAGSAAIEDELGAIAVKGFGAPHCHVFAPPGRDELCIEPVNHAPDALNRSPREMIVLPPGCVAGIAMRLEATLPR